VERHQTELSLPFKGKWLVLWGGDTKELNQHHDVANQRFAFDFVVADETGKTHKGDGSANEDYFAFGREVISPADGEVTDVISGVRDNVPGSMNPYSAVGNAVIIRHRENEVSVLAHLKLDSIKVKVGDKVARGQLIGLCGNSGNSSEPHLHYHLQNTAIIQDGTGIKCLFHKITVISSGQQQVKTDYSPVKGDVVVAD
jgi:murein DD-endopeptidase MepM/ murein hydrolase activator NlpD